MNGSPLTVHLRREPMHNRHHTLTPEANSPYAVVLAVPIIVVAVRSGSAEEPSVRAASVRLMLLTRPVGVAEGKSVFIALLD